MADVARAAGLSRATVCQHFSDRDSSQSDGGDESTERFRAKLRAFLVRALLLEIG